MGFTFVPEYIFRTFDEASADFLYNIGVRGIILDVDNTLEPYENALPGEKVTVWLNSLKERGISASIVSNNNRDRIELFNSELKLPAYYKAKKPFKKNLIRAMADMNTTKENISNRKEEAHGQKKLSAFKLGNPCKCAAVSAIYSTCGGS